MGTEERIEKLEDKVGDLEKLCAADSQWKEQHEIDARRRDEASISRHIETMSALKDLYTLNRENCKAISKFEEYIAGHNKIHTDIVKFTDDIKSRTSELEKENWKKITSATLLGLAIAWAGVWIADHFGWGKHDTMPKL